MSDGLVSVLCPSRSRPELLRRSIRSLFLMAADTRSVEVLVAADPDDEPTARVAVEEGVQCLVAPRRFGYLQLNEYFNFLCTQANGDWLLLWNDDAVMRSYGWEHEMLSKEPGILCLHGNHDPFNAFPAVHRIVYEAMGHFSLSNHNDSWLHDVGLGAGCLIQTQIEVFHDRFDLTGNNNDEIYHVSSHGYTTHLYYGQELAEARAEDIRKVVAALARLRDSETAMVEPTS